MKQAILGFALLALSPQPAWAVDVSGIVYNMASNVEREVQLVDKATVPKGNISLCASPMRDRISRLEGYRVQVGGNWQKDGSKKTECLAPSTFEIKEGISPSAELLIGKLTEEKDKFYLLDEKRGKILVGAPSAGIRKLKDKKVIFHAKDLEADLEAGQDLKVVSYREFP